MNNVMQAKAAAAATSGTRAAAKKAPELLREAVAAFDNLRAEAREQMQAATSPKMRNLLDKLDKGSPLSDEDKTLLRIWLVGDAAAYVTAENDYQGWLAELERLSAAVADKAAVDMTPQALMELSGLCEDALNLLPNIQKYIEQNDRLQRFEETLRNLGPQDYKFLYGVLKLKLDYSRD